MTGGVPKATIAALACAIVMLSAVSARADPYDDCILAHVSASQDRTARREIIDRGATERLMISLDTMDDYTWWQSHTVTVTATKGIPRSGGWWPFT